MTGEHPQSDEKDIAQDSDLVVAAKPVDSGENFFSLYKPVKGIVESIKTRAIAMVELASSLGATTSLPVAPMVDAVNSQIYQKKVALEKIKASDHESAHFLLSVLNNSPMNDVWLSPHGEYTSYALGLPGGSVSLQHSTSIFDRSSIRGSFEKVINPTALDASKLSDEQIVRHTFMLLAGDSVNADIEGEERGRMKISLDKRFVLPAVGSDDISRVKQILKTTKYRGVEKSVFDLLTDRIMKFLSDPGVRKIVDIFSVKLLESGHIHNKGESIVPMMMKLLEENGVSKEEFESFQKRYSEMVKVTAVEMRGLVGVD